jgi:hypothetical protein
MRIEKKVYKKYFDSILSGDKKFELRLADWDCAIGDVLVLREVDENKNYTGRKIAKDVTYVIRTKDIDFFTKDEVEKHGFQIISFD